MAKKKAIIRLNAYSLISDAVESGLGFALNRLDDVLDNCLTEEQRESATGPMLNEIMIALENVIDWEKSA